MLSDPVNSLIISFFCARLHERAEFILFTSIRLKLNPLRTQTDPTILCFASRLQNCFGYLMRYFFIWKPFLKVEGHGRGTNIKGTRPSRPKKTIITTQWQSHSLVLSAATEQTKLFLPLSKYFTYEPIEGQDIRKWMENF